jgi:2-amino-4-hydroxy-6-hydroxymethyldihydropteridine diphosphokinase
MDAAPYTLDEAVIVALGSNLADAASSPKLLLEAALNRFPALGLTLRDRSEWWRSSAWPDPSQPAYLNGVVFVETRLPPGSVLAALLGLEGAFGRIRGEVNAARVLDLDLIAHGRQVIREPGLTLPHPRASDRLFVMGPLAQIAPLWVHPVSGRTAGSLAAEARIGVDAAPLCPPGR